MKYLIAGGGTAGHINPALALASAIKFNDPSAEILFVGAKGRMEEQLIPKSGYKLALIRVYGFQRKLNLKNLKHNFAAIYYLIASRKKVTKIIDEFKPDIVVGTGGYVSGPVLLKAVKLGIPTAIHEQNAYPGITTKLLASKVDLTMLATEEAKKHLNIKGRTAITGNPVREEFIFAKKEPSRLELGLDERPVILSYGGSLGAEKINRTVAELIAYSAKTKKYQHIHSTGRNHLKKFKETLRQLGVNLADNPQIRIFDYISNMGSCFAASDLIISRAGAITVSELQVQGKPAILIPSPNVSENHQYHNGMALQKSGGAIVIEENHLTGEKLIKEVDNLLSDKDRLIEMGRNCSKGAVFDSGQQMYQSIIELYNSKTK